LFRPKLKTDDDDLIAGLGFLVSDFGSIRMSVATLFILVKNTQPISADRL
jgi:hypothetical protein